MKNEEYSKIISIYGKDIINSEKIKVLQGFIQHSNISVYEHSFMVAIYCIKIARLLNIKVDQRALIRGALLHDYFLYDWHDKSHKWHGFTHAKTALTNADRDFGLSDIEKNMIYCHMFPLNIRIPKYRESLILLTADKICATKETIIPRLLKLKNKLIFSNSN